MHMADRVYACKLVYSLSHQWGMRSYPTQELSSKPDVEYIPGGATQNSIRVAQWVLRTPGATGYFGCIGSDEYGKIMRDFATRDGVDVRRLTCLTIACMCNVSLCHGVSL